MTISSSKRNYGALIYFSGPDGAGKSTAIRISETILINQDIKYKKFYSLNKFLRYFGKRINWLFLTLLNKNNGHSFRQYITNSKGHEDRDTGKKVWRIKKRVLLLLALIDVWLGYFYALYYRLSGFTVLIDTSPYDLFIKYHTPRFRILELFFSPMVPRPTFGFILKAPATQIRERKPELYIDEIENYYDRFADILSKIPTSLYHSINTGEGEGKTFNEIESILVS